MFGIVQIRHVWHLIGSDGVNDKNWSLLWSREEESIHLLITSANISQHITTSKHQ